MKKHLCWLLGAGLISSGAYAVPADPEPKTVVQPDGSELTVMIRGDERSNMLFTSDNIPLFLNAETGAFEYALVREGRIAGSGIMASEASARDKATVEWLGRLDTGEVVRMAMAAPRMGMSKAPGRSDYLISDYPTTGKQRTLAILVQFSDVKFESMADPLQFYTDMLNKEGFTHENGANGSARDFYIATSMGAFDPEFDVYGPVTLSRESTYYGKDDPGQDTYMGDFLTEALAIADDDVDFSQYDLDNNGYIDNVFFFYAGGGQADDPNGKDFIWPHSAEADEAWNVSIELDGKKFRHYACSNEVRYSSDGSKIPTGIGTFVHEFGHVLGLCDHYDTFKGMFTHHPYEWDTMASGSYNNNMHTPPLFSGFERAELGWMEYEDITPDSAGIIEIPWIGETNKAFRMKVPGTENEFYVFENRQLEGFDRFLPNHGMLVWHIDQDMELWQKNQVNTDPSHQRIDVVEADRKADRSSMKGDTFPGSDAVSQFSLLDWNGDSVSGFEDVTEEDGMIYLLLSGTDFKPDTPSEIEVEEADDTSFTLSWTPVRYAKYYLLTVADALTGEPVGTFSDKRVFSTENVEVPFLEADHEYEVRVRSGIGSYLSDELSLKVRTTEVPFSKLRPENVKASDVRHSSFVASWDGLRDAEEYEINLTQNSWSEEVGQKGYGFDDKQNGLPVLWNTSSNSYYSVKDWYGAASPSLRFSKDGDNLTAAYPEAKIVSLSLWCRAKSEGQKIKVETSSGEDGFVELRSLDVPVDGGTVSIDIPGSDCVKLTYVRTDGFVVIDDVRLGCTTLERIPVEKYSGFAVGSPEVLLEGLTPQVTYGLQVNGVADGNHSAPSAEITVTLPADAGVEGICGDDEKTGVFDLTGRSYPDAGSLEQGIYIVNGIKTIIR